MTKTAITAIVQRDLIDGNKPLNVVAKRVGKTSGQTAFVKMLLDVEAGRVPAIKGRTEKELIARTVAARKRADKFSSWGWLAARTGVGEPKLKKMCEGKYEVFGSRIATERAAKKAK